MQQGFQIRHRLIQVDHFWFKHLLAAKSQQLPGKVCAPVHDAFLVMAPIEQASRVIEHMTTIMEEVALRLCGFPIKVDHQPIYPGQRWIEDDPDIIGMRDLVLSCLSRVEAKAGVKVLTSA